MKLAPSRELLSAITAARSAPSVRRVPLVAAAILILTWALPMLIRTDHARSGRWETPGPVLLLGLIIGLTYGLLAVGLVLIYRTNRIINFAHGQVGAFGAAVFGVAVVQWHIPYWVAFVPALAVTAAVGALAEATVVRRLRRAPAIMSVVATLGVGQFLVLFAFAINSQITSGSLYPMPSFLPEFRFGGLLVTPAYSGMLMLSPVLVILIGGFLKLTRYGMAIRASADNADAARMSAIYASRMSTLAWAIAGALAGFAAILTQPTQGFSRGENFGPALLLVALAGAVLARMQSLPRALIAGIAIAVVEQLLLWNYGQAGFVQLALFVIILVTLVVQRQRVGRSEGKGSWATVQAQRPVPGAIRQLRSVRLVAPAIATVTLVALVLAPRLLSNANSTKLTSMFAFIVIALSVTVVTGLGGQLSLGQFALGAVGAVISYEVSRRTGNYAMSFLYGGLVAALVSVVIGIPALRVKGLLLTVTTLSFGLVMPAFILQHDAVLGSGKSPGRPTVAGQLLDTGRAYYYVGLLTLVVAFVLVRNVRSGGLGRRLVAVRDNEEAARAFAIPAALVKVQGFAVAGFIAGLGGAMYGHSLSLISARTFPVRASIDVVVIAVIGGIGLLSGPLLGGALVQGATFLPLDSAGLAATSFGQLLIIMYLPGGLGSLVIPVRDRLVNWLARRAGVDIAAAYAEERGFTTTQAAPPKPVTRRDSGRRAVPRTELLLQARDLHKSFGGVHAVRGIDLDVFGAETLGLIGPNGAGKTTTFELLSGFTRADSGVVAYQGRDVTHLGPVARARLGLIRSFQDAALFPTMTVLECVQVALERQHPTDLMPSILGLRRAERRKLAQAQELVAWIGLDRYRSTRIQELSTGTRRIAEIACLVALEPELLLLDEPSSGIAQRETEALGELILRLKADLEMTLVIIEHDIPLIMSLADRIICMADGRIIASGAPNVVRHEPSVVEAYLGGSITAIERSAGRRGDTERSHSLHSIDDCLALAAAVPGLGTTRSAALVAALGSVESVRRATSDELTSVRGIGPALATRIQTTLRETRRNDGRGIPTHGR